MSVVLNTIPEEPAKIQRIISVCLHQIDVDSQQIKRIHISSDNPDLESYLSDLLDEVNKKKQKRSYSFLRETTEFYGALSQYYLNQDLPVNTVSTNLANRLLDKEITADDKYGHLGKEGKGHVKKGSFLQFLYRDGDLISFLGVKIEHQIFLDEMDFTKKIGLSIINKIYKACKVSFTDTGMPNTVNVYDTNSKPSVFWWSDFLELKELRTDAYNTRQASDRVIKIINTIKKDYPIDYTILRNTVIGSFKQKGEMDYVEFVNNTFEHYKPEDRNLEEKMPSLTQRIRDLPEKKNFDTKFTLVPSEVPFNKRKYDLTKEISISISDGIENIDHKIWSEKTSCGKELVVIDSPEGFKHFTKKKRV